MLYDKRSENEGEAPVKSLEPWQQTLLEAAEYLRDHGWCQDIWRSEDGRVCLFGSVYTVSDCLMNDGYKVATQKLARRGASFAWNDVPGRTKEEVIAMLEDTAKAG